MKMLSVSHKPTETIQFFQLWPLTPSVMIRVQQTIEGHEEVTWGQMSSNGVLIRFSPISGDRMEIETCIWCQTTWLVKPLRKMGILTYLGHGLALSWPDLRSNFETDLSRSKVYVSNWLDETNATVSYYFRVSLIKKVLNEKPSPWKRKFFIWWPLEPNLLTLGSVWSKNAIGAWRELLNANFEFFLAIILLEIIALVLEKSIFSQNLTFADSGDLIVGLIWKWPFKSLRYRRGLSYDVYHLSLSNLVFRSEGVLKPRHKLKHLAPANNRVNPRPLGYLAKRARRAGEQIPPLPNSRTGGRSEAGEAAIESPWCAPFEQCLKIS